MKTKFLKHIEGLCLPETEKFLLAISGGLDSMVMLHLFQSQKLSFEVAHMNFQLRGNASDEDEQFVRNWCGKHKIAFHSKRVDTNKYATENKLSTQMAARELRYDWFDELLSIVKADYVCTAHHLNDSIETVLINLARGTGIEGMTGIPVKSKNRLRPLLFASRQQIEEYAAEHSIAWREDSSNATDDYQRNLIRHQVVPILKRINPSLEETFKESVNKIEGELALLKNKIEAWKNDYWAIEIDAIKIKKTGFNSHESGALLWHGIKDFGFNYSTCQDIIDSLHGQSGKQFLSDSHKLVIDRDYIIITVLNNNLTEVLIGEKQLSVEHGLWRLSVKHGSRFKLPANQQEASFDQTKLTYPLTWRTWRAGDYFYPLGMTHRKKISDFLIDSKISVGEKDSVTVLESAGEIAWVVGHRIDNRFKITDSTNQVITLALGHI